MATLPTWTIRDALTAINVRLTLLQTNPALNTAQQDLVTQMLNATNLALSALRADNTIIPGQRATRAQAILDRILALVTVEAQTENIVGIDAFYNALDLATDSVEAIKNGIGSFNSDLGPV